MAAVMGQPFPLILSHWTQLECTAKKCTVSTLQGQISGPISNLKSIGNLVVSMWFWYFFCVRSYNYDQGF
jgi:hypothetical protein